MVMPRSRSWWVKSSMISWSMKSRKLSRGSTSETATSSALKMVAYSTPMTPAPITVKLRGSCVSSTISSLSRMLLAVEGDLRRPVGPGADRDEDLVAVDPR